MSGHFVSDFPDSGSVDYSDQSTNLDETAIAELNELAGRYPHPRSALLPMLHLVQSYDGRISPRGIELCAEILGITTAQVSGVATFYTMFKRRPAGHHHLGVCTTALCAVMGGDILLERAKQRLGIDEGQTTPCGRVSLERLECNAACDYAPVAMVNWEFFDDMTPEKLDELIDALMNGDEVVFPARGHHHVLEEGRTGARRVPRRARRRGSLRRARIHPRQANRRREGLERPRSRQSAGRTRGGDEVSDLLAPVLSDQWGQDKSWKLSRYEAAGGYRALRKAQIGRAHV